MTLFDNFQLTIKRVKNMMIMMGADARNWPAAPKKTPREEKFFIAQI